MKKFASIFSVLLAMSITLTACGKTAPASGAETPSQSTPQSAESSDLVPADTLRVVLGSEPPNADPHNNTRLTSWAVQEEIFDKLVQKDEEGNILPDLATSWEQIDDCTLRFYLRDDVTFHDGSKLTAEDVAFSLKRACVSAGSQSFFINFDPEGMVVVDEYTVDVATKQPFAAALNYLATARGAILCKAAVESMGDEAYGLNPIGSGPFKVETWSVGNEIVLKRNEEYWGEKPSYETLQFRFITEASNRAIELETGNADIVYSIASNDAARLADKEGVEIVSGPAYNFVYICMNMSDPTLSNEKLREALSTATNVPALVAAAYSESEQVADSYMSPNVAYHASMEAKEYNVEKAKQLLAEAGYPDGLTLTLTVNEDTTFGFIAEIIQGMWQEIGVQVKIETMEQATYLERANAGEVQLSVTSSNAVSGDPDNAFMIWRTTAVNAIQANDPTIDDYLNKGGVEFDPEARAAIYKDLQQYLWDKNYGIPLCFPNVTYGIDADIEGFYCHPGSTPDLAKVVVYQ